MVKSPLEKCVTEEKLGPVKRKGHCNFKQQSLEKALKYYDTLVKTKKKKKKERERERPHRVDIGGKIFFTDRTSSKQMS